MNYRVITIISLLQVSIVVYALLFCGATIKVFETAYGEQHLPLAPHIMKYFGIYLLFVPALWGAYALISEKYIPMPFSDEKLIFGVGLIIALFIFLWGTLSGAIMLWNTFGTW